MLQLIPYMTYRVLPIFFWSLGVRCACPWHTLAVPKSLLCGLRCGLLSAPNDTGVRCTSSVDVLRSWHWFLNGSVVPLVSESETVYSAMFYMLYTNDLRNIWLMLSKPIMSKPSISSDASDWFESLKKQPCWRLTAYVKLESLRDVKEDNYSWNIKKT